MELFNLEDITPIAHVVGDENTILFIRKEDVNKEDAVAVKIFADNTQRYCFGLVANFIEYSMYEMVGQDDELTVYYLNSRLNMTFDGDSLLDMLMTFRDELEKWEKLENRFQYPASKIYNLDRVKNV